jgi:hypothetical protein
MPATKVAQTLPAGLIPRKGALARTTMGLARAAPLEWSADFSSFRAFCRHFTISASRGNELSVDATTVGIRNGLEHSSFNRKFTKS